MKISSGDAFKQFRQAGINFFTGVPDSLLKDFCSFAHDHLSHEEHVITANEGSSIALATGHYLSTRLPSLVYFQNSGLGNAINPLLSLAHKEVYCIPMILLIGWRGETGLKDEPQHTLQGSITPGLLDVMDIPWFEIGPHCPDPEKKLRDALQAMKIDSAPVAILVRKNSFESYEFYQSEKPKFVLTREEAIQTIAKNLSRDELIVSTTGYASRELFEFRKETKGTIGEDFLTIGSMGHASSIAAGIALGKPDKKVICIDGDGSFLMHMGSSAVNTSLELNNFVHIVINNGSHDSVGGQPTVAMKVNLKQIAKACGSNKAISVNNKADLIKTLENLKYINGPIFIEVMVRKGVRPDLGRPSTTPIQNKKTFMEKIKGKN